MKLAVGLYDIDGRIPNIALMKISTYYKRSGYEVFLNPPANQPVDRSFASVVFSWTDTTVLPEGTVIGGSGHAVATKLPPSVDLLECDYSLYPEFDKAIGFLTRGCNRKCKWCVVPEKEGKIKPYADIEFIAQGRRDVLLLDNNVLASDYGIEQLEKIIRLNLRVDFNQGMDARLLNDEIAAILTRIKWIRFIRLACDNDAMIDPVVKAVKAIRKIKPKKQIMAYVLVEDIPSALRRVELLRGMNVDPFAQPYRPPSGEKPALKLRQFARWVNHKAIFKTTKWADYIGGPFK